MLASYSRRRHERTIECNRTCAACSNRQVCATATQIAYAIRLLALAWSELHSSVGLWYYRTAQVGLEHATVSHPTAPTETACVKPWMLEMSYAWGVYLFPVSTRPHR